MTRATMSRPPLSRSRSFRLRRRAALAGVGPGVELLDLLLEMPYWVVWSVWNALLSTESTTSVNVTMGMNLIERNMSSVRKRASACGTREPPEVVPPSPRRRDDDFFRNNARFLGASPSSVTISAVAWLSVHDVPLASCSTWSSFENALLVNPSQFSVSSVTKYNSVIMQ
ncbi:hypothetical protein H257_04363 [Aphanomyces astaci]|uniref:Uncharacterized protein n=1 Tax=Aphanomyces astaci TaxID=112090 RepID=W4GVF9_APHAT|nr:hypothetical protein H257_04363 [Aphanomyces astaci]ETV83700.1 hypothetical protein H257_04363 [Aphanomyces astaci]|eukprot:XP_009827130.1 hypothetical protein H257_04363 [Aphanomyces astaci]